jgi:hypothetical protein
MFIIDIIFSNIFDQWLVESEDTKLTDMEHTDTKANCIP